MQGLTESLAVRVATVDLLGVSPAEQHNRALLCEPFEIKKTAAPSVQATQQLAAAINTGKPVAPGAVLCLIPRDVPMSAGVTAILMVYL